MLIKNVQIITMEHKTNVIKNGFIIVHNTKIAKIGEMKDLPAGFSCNKVIDGNGKLVLPGLINTHTHSAMIPFRGFADDMDLSNWLSLIWPIEDKLTSEDAYWLSLLAIMEMISDGITTFVDMYMFMDKTAEAVELSGIRAILARGLQGPDERSEMRLRQAKDLWVHWNNQADGRIKVAIAPHALYTCEPMYLAKCVDLAAQLDCMIHIHAAETSWEFDYCKELYGQTPIQFLHSNGIFERRALAAHCVHITDEDMDIMLGSSVSVAYCPSSNLKLASGFAPVVKMLEKGILVTLGTDSAASNNTLSILKEMHIAALVNKALKSDPSVLDAYRVLEMATSNAARTLHLEEHLGCIRHGMKADLVIIDNSSSRYFPKNDPVASLIYAGRGCDVETVIIDGRVVMENREFKTIDIEKIKYETERICMRLLKD